jgi:hypothetical protein
MFSVPVWMPILRRNFTSSRVSISDVVKVGQMVSAQ